MLIVEDEALIAIDLQQRLEALGYAVIGICNEGEEAAHRALEEHPDVILMDVMLGGNMDGIEAASAIRRVDDVPVIFLTGREDDDAVTRAQKIEPAGYLLKPFRDRELQATIEIALFRKHAVAQLKEQENLLEAIFNSMQDGLIAVDDHARIRMANPVAREILGLRKDVSGSCSLDTCFQIFDEKTGDAVSLPFHEITPAQSYFFDNMVIRTRHGGKVSVTGSVTRLETGDETSHKNLITFQDVTSLREMSRTIQYQASHDALTGLMNRDELIRQLKEPHQPLSGVATSRYLCYLDLDRFTLVNDVAGHQAGDALLRRTAEDLGRFSRYMDAATARLGGDEFVVILPDTGKEPIGSIASQINQQISKKFFWEDQVFNITASIGIVSIPDKLIDPDRILAAARDASSLAKESGGNTFRLYENRDHVYQQRRTQMQWISRLNEALDSDQFELWYQEIVPTQAVSPPHREVLLRLIDPEEGVVSPAQFIPAAEKYNLMPAVDRWVLRNLANYLQSNDDPSDTTIYGVNISGASLLEEAFLVDAEALLRTAFPHPKRICLEITETTAFENTAQVQQFMRTLKELGVTFALDDFGKGFSSFAYLRRLPVDYLKIDGSFVSGITTSATDAALVRAINEIGHVMGLKTVAEFVKDEETKRAVTAIGVDFLQGNGLAVPAPLR